MRATSPARTVAYVFLAVAVAMAFDSCANRRYAPPPTPDGSVAEGVGSRSRQSNVIMRRSVPERIQIPAIGVDAELTRLDLESDGRVEVPPLDRPELAGWYADGVTPGERGPATIYGHVDTKEGTAVFYRLGELKPGDEIRLHRSDGSAAVFAVDSVEVFAKRSFPTRRVYGPTEAPELRLITCGGEFDPDTDGYLANVVAFAGFVRPVPAGDAPPRG
ncbi:class F sortase [Nonomuraea dietziae]|uniref:class F sortase n=1 Tax=Nonomuraea dietziae TaxID=65515 RepID=UPI0033F4C758